MGVRGLCDQLSLERSETLEKVGAERPEVLVLLKTYKRTKVLYSEDIIDPLLQVKVSY